ncbi:MAG: hypothetical protein J7497_05010 [Chitinophagaceae bacterium]|nr:hypothetical protein [Chitinophagaceae bacterium]
MKRLSLSCLLFSGAAFFFASCRNGNEKKASETTGVTDTVTATTHAPTVNTIVTAPENMVIVIHKVANYAKWKSGYDMDDSARLASGLHSYVIGRGLRDSSMVLIAMKADDMPKAKAFAASANLKKVMQKAGVIGKPDIHFFIATWQDTSNVGSLPRSLNTFTVKEWDTWQKSFEAGKQERIDNGILARVIGHDADDNKKVNVVTALEDTTKAFAYYKSDALKKRMASAGVVGEPKRFVFRIAERY